MENAVKTLLARNWLMALCGGFYLAWWIIVFRPPGPRSTPVGWGLLALAFLTGLAGFYGMGRVLASPFPEVRSGVRGLWIVTAGVVLYLVLLVGTALLFHRQVTSELLIITAWTALELCTVSYLYRVGTLSERAAVPLAAVILMAAAVSLVCYLLYYRLPYRAGYFDGCVPLALAIAVIAAVNLAAARTI